MSTRRSRFTLTPRRLEEPPDRDVSRPPVTMPSQELSPYSPRRVVQKLRYRREEDASSRPKHSDSHTPSTLKKLFSSGTWSSRSWRVDTSAQVEEVEDLKAARFDMRETREVRRLERKICTKVDKDNQDPIRAVSRPHKFANAEAEMATLGKSRPRVNTVGGTSTKTKVVASSAIHHVKPKAGTAAADFRMYEPRRRLLASVPPVEPRSRQDPPGPTRRVAAAPAQVSPRRSPRVDTDAVSLKPDERTLPVTKPRVLSNLNFVPTQPHLESYKTPTSTPRPRERRHRSEADSPTAAETYTTPTTPRKHRSEVDAPTTTEIKTPTSTPRPRERKHRSEVDAPTTTESSKTPTSTPRPRKHKHRAQLDSQTMSMDPVVLRPDGTSLPAPRTERSDSSVPIPRPPHFLHRKLTATYITNKEPAHTRHVPPRNLTPRPKQEPYESTLNPFVLSSSQAQIAGAKTVDKSPSRTRADAVYNWKMARHYIDSLRTDLDQMHINGVPFRNWKTEPVETLGQSAGRPQKMHKATVPSNGVHGPVGVFLKRVPYRIWYNQWRSMIDWQGDYVTDGENYVMEAAVMAFLTNNNIPLGPKLIAVATVHGSGNQPYEMVLVSELYGQDLLEHLARQGRRRLSEAQRFRLQYKVTQLQANLHKAGIAHLDFTPENVLIGSEGLRLCDFAKACPLSTRYPRHVQLQHTAQRFAFESCEPTVGKTAYMPPECWQIYHRFMRVQVNGKLVQSPLADLKHLTRFNDREEWYFDVARADTWMLGCFLFWIWSDNALWRTSNPQECPEFKSLFDRGMEISSNENGHHWPENLRHLVSLALSPKPRRRPSPKEMLYSQWFEQMKAEYETR